MADCRAVMLDSKLNLNRPHVLDRKNKNGAQARILASGSTETSLRQKRRERLKAVSDEALSALDEDTLMLMAKRK